MLTGQDIGLLSCNEDYKKIFYGKDKNQHGLLRVPKDKGQHKVIITVHGGCWSNQFARANFIEPFTQALQKSSYAIWNIEYRCCDDESGGWPNTFLDIANAINHIKNLKEEYNLDTENIILLGHSSGGHLAHWYASKHKLKEDSEIFTSNQINLKAVFNVAGPTDLKTFAPRQRECCRDIPVVDMLLGLPNKNEELRYTESSPTSLLPLNTDKHKIQQVLITGDKDDAIPPASFKPHQDKAIQNKDNVKTVIIQNCGHFDYLDPSTQSFKDLLQEIDLMCKK